MTLTLTLALTLTLTLTHHSTQYLSPFILSMIVDAISPCSILTLTLFGGAVSPYSIFRHGESFSLQHFGFIDLG